jgi:hypothetical protein
MNAVDSDIRIEPYFRNEASMRQLWCFQDEFSVTARLATQLYPVSGAKTESTAAAEFFIDYTCVFLIKKPSDFLYLLKCFSKKEDKAKFMQIYSRNHLIDPFVLEALLHDADTIRQIGEYPDWIDLPIRLRARKLIDNSLPNSLTVYSLIPDSVNLSPSTVEYIISWAYEESKLCAEGIEYFRTHFPDKFKMLSNLRRGD